MNKAPYVNKAVGSETKITKPVPKPEPVDPIVKECKDINELSGNAYQKARHAYLRDIKLRDPKLLKKVMSLLVK